MTAHDSISHFEALHRASSDPWGVHTRWYERRKRALLLASLPRERYAFGFEPGCSIGGNTLALADRCEHLLATDASPSAIVEAKKRTGDRRNLQVELGSFPQRWPQQPVDLLVLAELAYYLPPEDFEQALSSASARMQAGGHFVMCHWRHQVGDADTHGDAVHALAAERLGRGFTKVGGWCDEDMRIDVWQQGDGTSSVAELGDALEIQERRRAAPA